MNLTFEDEKPKSLSDEGRCPPYPPPFPPRSYPNLPSRCVILKNLISISQFSF